MLKAVEYDTFIGLTLIIKKILLAVCVEAYKIKYLTISTYLINVNSFFVKFIRKNVSQSS